jgi:hypothetical protein
LHGAEKKNWAICILKERKRRRKCLGQEEKMEVNSLDNMKEGDGDGRKTKD